MVRPVPRSIARAHLSRAGCNCKSAVDAGQKNASWRFPLWMSLCLAAALSTAGCAGYRFGAQTLYPYEIRTVYVPMFESNSYRRNLGEWLTEAVIKEIETKTPYKVVHRADADSILTGTLVSDTKRVVLVSPTDEPRESELNLMVQVRWLDRRGNVLREHAGLPVPTELVDVTGTASVVPEVGQTIVTGQQTAIDRLSKQIVSLMEAPW